MRKVVAAAAAALSLPILAVGPASATDSGVVAQITNGDNKSTVPVIDGAGDNIIFHSLSLLGETGGGFSGIDDTFVADNTASPATTARVVVDGVFPDISANGQWAVYTAPGDTNQVVRLKLSDGTKVSVTNGNADSGTFGNLPGARVDDAGNVVFQSLATNLVGSDPDAASNDSTDGTTGWDVYFWNGSSTVKLSDASQINFLFPDIAADGSVIAYSSASSGSLGERRVYSNVPAGGGQTTVANGNGRDEMPKVSDDGSEIAFRSDSTDLDGGNSTPNVFVASGSTIDRVTNLGGTSGVTNPTISGDGAFVAFQYDGEIHRVAVSDGSSLQVSDNTPAGAIDYAALNSDGSKIAYAQSTDGTVAGVQIMAWDANATVVPPDPVTPPAPTYCDFNDPILSSTYQGSSGVDARIARLYGAFFLRSPDTGGFAFWQGIINAGNWTNERAAQFFGTGTEFVGLYGSDLSNTEFVTTLYNNVFCREPDEGGLEFWLGRMDQGWTRGQVALGFSDGEEFRGRTNTN